ncbi:hypothetical protein [Novosphingobium beihaiensis]|uniref:Uncharacterized protein n=1 Tax=Novosphingobium beihaiensis TaxID=2930389 RepID=A0ABT0BVH4_9SPHN|nr:hypothetical protein [Novosphingobium beihaiensis]MCJ2188933.1 hypothetical protein [Novosphingobium beihaiensis]
MDLTQRIAYFLILILSVGLALWKGGAPERAGALVFILMAVIQALVMAFIPSHFVRVDPDALVADLTGFLGFGYLALEARRFWPLWATSLQVLCLSAHFARWADIGIYPMVYAVMRGAPTFGVAIAILIGTLLHMYRLRRRGSDPSWQSWSRHAAG